MLFKVLFIWIHAYKYINIFYKMGGANNFNAIMYGIYIFCLHHGIPGASCTPLSFEDTIAHRYYHP